MMTPYDKLHSLPNAERYLKAGVTFEQLDSTASQLSDLQAWDQMQKARTQLFDTIFGQTPRVA